MICLDPLRHCPKQSVFATLVAQHNDPNDYYHLDMFETIVIGSDLQAELDIVHLNITSLWLLSNIVLDMSASGYSS